MYEGMTDEYEVQLVPTSAGLCSTFKGMEICRCKNHILLKCKPSLKILLLLNFQAVCTYM